jgi:hypothetical protein
MHVLALPPIRQSPHAVDQAAVRHARGAVVVPRAMLGQGCGSDVLELR